MLNHQRVKEYVKISSCKRPQFQVTTGHFLELQNLALEICLNERVDSVRLWGNVHLQESKQPTKNFMSYRNSFIHPPSAFQEPGNWLAQI